MPAPAAVVKPLPATSAKPVPEVKPKPQEVPAPKVPEKPALNATQKPVEKSTDKPVAVQAGKPPEAVAAANTPLAGKEAWVIQLGSFTAEANAQTLLGQVQRAGVSAKVERIDVKGSSVWRVTSASYATRAEADAALNVLKTKLNLGGMVRSVR